MALPGGSSTSSRWAAKPLRLYVLAMAAISYRLNLNTLSCYSFSISFLELTIWTGKLQSKSVIGSNGLMNNAMRECWWFRVKVSWWWKGDWKGGWNNGRHFVFLLPAPQTLTIFKNRFKIHFNSNLFQIRHSTKTFRAIQFNSIQMQWNSSETLNITLNSNLISIKKKPLLLIITSISID